MRGEPAMLAYGIFPPYQRQGFALEGVGAVAAHVAAAHGVERIGAEIDARNAPSIAFAKRLGMHEVGRENVDDDRTCARGIELRYEGPAFTI